MVCLSHRHSFELWGLLNLILTRLTINHSVWIIEEMEKFVFSNLTINWSSLDMNYNSRKEKKKVCICICVHVYFINTCIYSHKYTRNFRTTEVNEWTALATQKLYLSVKMNKLPPFVHYIFIVFVKYCSFRWAR